MADASFYQLDADTVSATLADLAKQQASLDALYERWEELENT